MWCLLLGLSALAVVANGCSRAPEIGTTTAAGAGAPSADSSVNGASGGGAGGSSGGTSADGQSGSGGVAGVVGTGGRPSAGGATSGGDSSVGGAPPAPCGGAPNAGSGGAAGVVGCYASTANGWQRVPCNCELPLINDGPSALDLKITLKVEPGGTTPSLTSSPDIEVAFDDPDSTWYDVWLAQQATAGSISTAHSGHTTTVRLGAAEVTLDRVLLPGCQSRMGMGAVSGTYTETLAMTAVFLDGTGSEVLTTVGSCINPMPP